VELASAEQRAAIAAYGQAAFNGFSEVESSLDAGTILLQQVSDLSSALAAASEAYRIAKVRFDEGDMNLFDLLSVEQRTFERHIELNRVQRAVLEQRVNLYLALGGSWG
jgi:outer membrane protein TolC